MTAAERLRETLADAVARGDSWPCQDDDGWTSEDHAERVEAARRCTPCPVTSLCAAAALEDPPTWGVWSGVDYGDKVQRRAAIRAAGVAS